VHYYYDYDCYESKEDYAGIKSLLQWSGFKKKSRLNENGNNLSVSGNVGSERFSRLSSEMNEDYLKVLSSLYGYSLRKSSKRSTVSSTRKILSHSSSNKRLDSMSRSPGTSFSSNVRAAQKHNLPETDGLTNTNPLSTTSFKKRLSGLFRTPRSSSYISLNKITDPLVKLKSISNSNESDHKRVIIGRKARLQNISPKFENNHPPVNVSSESLSEKNISLQTRHSF